MNLLRLTDLIKKNLFWLLLIIAGCVINFAPIYVPSNIPIAGKVFPAKQWLVHAGTNGQFMNTQTDLVAGVSNVYESREFTRGDDVRFEINPNILEKNLIQKNDTIGLIFSNETMMMLNSARKELNVKEAILNSSRSGQKKEAVELAKKQLEFAKIDAESQRLTYERKKILFEQNVIPDQEIEDHLRLYELKLAEVGIKKAELETLLSGEKPEDIELVKAEIEKIETEISDLEDKQQMQTIVSPITGIFRNSYSSDTLMLVESIDELIIKMPVLLKDRNKIFNGQKVTCTIYEQTTSFVSEVVHLSNHISVVGGKQTFIVTARIHSGDVELLPGMVFKGKLESDDVLLRDYVSKWFRFFRN